MEKLFVDREKLRGAIWGHRQEIADALGVIGTSVSRKISGSQKLTIDELNTIASVIKRDVSDFVYFSDAD